MFLYVGARAKIKINEKHESVKIKKITKNVNNGDLLDISLKYIDDKNEDNEDIEITINKTTGDVEGNNQSFSMVDKIKIKNMVDISPDNNNSETTRAEVIQINNDNKVVTFKINDTPIYIPFKSLQHFNFASATKSSDKEKKNQESSAYKELNKDNTDEEDQTEGVEEGDQDEDEGEDQNEGEDEEDEEKGEDEEEEGKEDDDLDQQSSEGTFDILDPEINYVSPEIRLYTAMYNALPLRNKTRENINKIRNECKSLFALEAITTGYPRKVNTINQFLEPNVTKIPSWILPIAHNKRVVNNEGTVNQDSNCTQNLGTPFENKKYIGAVENKKELKDYRLPKNTTSEAIIRTGPVMQPSDSSRGGLKENTKDNIIQVFLPSDIMLLDKNIDTMCIFKDLRDYSRMFIDNTNIYDKIGETSNRFVIEGVRQKNLKEKKKDDNSDSKYEYVKNLPSLEENIDYVILNVEENVTKLNLLVNTTFFIDQLNFSNFYWHDIVMREKGRMNIGWSKLKREVKKYQNRLRKKIQDSKEKILTMDQHYQRSQGVSINTKDLNLFKDSNFDYPEECNKQEKDMIADYNLPDNNICDSEALNKMMNIDYGDTYYKYLNYCNSNIQLIGGDVDIKNFFERQESLLCGNHAINNMFGEKKVISDFKQIDEEYVNGLLNLSYVCFECEQKYKKSTRLCVNDDGNYDAGVIMRAISLLNYDMKIYPASHIVDVDKCEFFPTPPTYNNDININDSVYSEKYALEDYNLASKNILDDTYVGSLIQRNSHFTALRLSEEKESLIFIDSISKERTKSIERDYVKIYNFFLETLGIDFGNSETFYTIINVHYKTNQNLLPQTNENVSPFTTDTPEIIQVIDSSEPSSTPIFGVMDDDDKDSVVDKYEDSIGDVIEYEMDGSENKSDTTQEKDKNDDGERLNDEERSGQNAEEDKSNRSINTTISSKMSSESKGDDDDDDEEEKENAELEKYVMKITENIREYDNYTCHKYKIENKNQMRESLDILTRLRDMENTRFMKYQIENYVTVNSLKIDKTYIEKLMDNTSSDNEETRYYNLVVQALSFSSENTLCWNKIDEIKNSLGKEWKIDLDNNSKKEWLMTFYKDPQENTYKTVKVMPYYLVRLSDFYNFGIGDIQDILNSDDKKDIEIKENYYVSTDYSGIALPISISGTGEETNYYSAPVQDPQLDTTPTTKNISSKLVTSFQDFLKNDFIDNINSAENAQIIRRCVDVWNSSRKLIDELTENYNNDNKKKKIIITYIIISITVICLQASDYFRDKRTKKKTNVDGNDINSVNILSGYPAETENGEEYNMSSLISYFASRLKKEDSSTPEEKVKKIKDIIGELLSLPVNKTFAEGIKKNVLYMRKNTPDEEWYKKQWSTFLPPLFPGGKSGTADAPPNDVGRLCSPETTYSTKFVFLNYIKTLSISAMNIQNKSTNNSNYNYSNPNLNTLRNGKIRIDAYAKLVRVCYNVPSTANFVVRRDPTTPNLIEQIKVFKFSESFRKRFIEFYCSKGVKSVMDLCGNKEMNITISDNKNNEEWFKQILNAVNMSNMKTNFFEKSSKIASNSSSSTEKDNKTEPEKIIDNCIEVKQSTTYESGDSGIKKDLDYFEENGFNKYIVNKNIVDEGGNSGNSNNINEMFSPLIRCKYTDDNKNIDKLVNDLFEFKPSVNVETTYNFLKVNISQFVNGACLRSSNNGNKKGGDETNKLVEWHKCWKDNLSYYGYSNEVFTEIIDKDRNNKDNVYQKIKFVLRFLLCMATASSEGSDLKIVNEKMIDCIEQICSKKKCFNKEIDDLRNELVSQKKDERDKHAKKYDNRKLDKGLLIMLNRAGLDQVTNARRNIDLGIE
jgi:hypothetical protein